MNDLTRPYEGNDRQFVSVFANPLYSEFIAAHQELQDYWNSPLYCVTRKPDGYREVCSNIHRGDFFGCGRLSQVGQVSAKFTVIQVSISPELQEPSPAGVGGDYIKYNISGDIGGHWYNPTHRHFIEGRHFIWLPTYERLLFAGFLQQADLLHDVMQQIMLRQTGR